LSSPPNGGVIRIGDTVTLQDFTVESGSTACRMADGDTYMAYPDGTIVQTLDAFNLSPGGAIICNGSPAPPCLAFAVQYKVKSTDPGTDLTIILPPRGTLTVAQTNTFGGVP